MGVLAGSIMTIALIAVAGLLVAVVLFRAMWRVAEPMKR